MCLEKGACSVKRRLVVTNREIIEEKSNLPYDHRASLIFTNSQVRDSKKSVAALINILILE